MKHRRLAASALLALAVTFGVTGAANATDEAPTPTPAAGTIACTAGGEGIEIKKGVVTIDGKEVASLSITKAIPAIPAEPGAQSGGSTTASAVPLPPGEAGGLADTLTVAPVPAKPFDGKPGEAVEPGKVTAAIPAGEAGVAVAKPTSPEGPTFSSDGPETPDGAKVVCFASAIPATPAAPAAPEAPEAPAED